MDELLQQIERLAAANQALTQRLDREHSMRLAAEEWIATLESQGNEATLREIAELVGAMLEHPTGPTQPAPNEGIVSAVRLLRGDVELWECRAHEAEAALEALRVERNRNARLFPVPVRAHGYTVHDLAVSSVCELLAAWGRLMDRNNARGAIAEARAAALLDAKDAASGAIGSLAWGNR